jgi:hypothetical protein
MLLNLVERENQDRLKQELQDEREATKLENLVAALVGRLLGVWVAVAKSGFQHGGDQGPAGQQGRRFRVECKKYSDSSSLSDRELLGEIDHALARDEAIEAWFLVTTRSVPEQLAQDLRQKGEKIGVPVEIFDWNDHEIAPLAALCAFDPDLVGAEFSMKAGDLARTLQPIAAHAIATLRRSMQSWCLGFEALRARSHDELDKIWTSPRASNAKLGQDAAGGAQDKKIKRTAVDSALNAWWQGAARTGSPAVVIGWDGVGKTWATLNWLVDGKHEQPIVLVVPSSAAADLSSVSETNVKRFLADRLYELSGTRNPEHWFRRLDYLLKRPKDEGVVLTVFFDGVNQEPSVSWLSILKVLQNESFEGRVRVLVSTRTHYFEDRLSKLRGLIVPAVLVKIDVYDTMPGGELNQMLAFEGLTRASLHPELLELARTPRLFKLVVRFRDRLVEAGQVTVHRLLWEYGRDTFGERAGKSFSEAEWRAWLKEIAERYRDGVREFSVKSLGETASRPDLSEREVYARLSDIIDGQFAIPGPSGNLQLTPTVVAHALGAALLAHLDTVAQSVFATIESELTQWLDPIGGLDQRAEILRAAVSILVERGGPTSTPLAGVLVTAWLQTQNVTDRHRQELAVLAPNLPYALLDAIERSGDRTHASARLWAVNALRTIPRTDTSALTVILTRVRDWFSIVSLDLDPRPDANADHNKRRLDRFRTRIGVDKPGPITVLGVNLQLIDRGDGVLPGTAPSIIEGFPLAKAQPIFEAAAIALAVSGRNDGWDGLKWLCLLNEVDPDDTAAALRDLSNALRLRSPESGVHPDLPARVAALLLWLSCRDVDEDAAVSIDPGIDHVLTYEKDYLPRPGRSFFALERRHAETALRDTELPLHVRVQRTKELWLDPTFEPPLSFVAEVREAATRIDVEKLDRHSGHTIEDHTFEEIEPVLARCAPDLLAHLICRKLQSATTCPPGSRYWIAIRATDHLVLAGKAEAAAAGNLRFSGTESDEDHEAFAANHLLMVELRDLDAQTQFDALIRAGLKFILTNFAEVLRPPTPAYVDTLIARYGAGSPKQQRDLLALLSIHPVAFSDTAWSWLAGFARQPEHEFCGLAFQTLTRADTARFGRMLAADGWSWSPDAHIWVNHYGTGALIEATLAMPFDQVAPRLAPWRLLEAARVRGADPNEIRLAAGIFGHVLAADKLEEPDPGSILSVDRTKAKSSPFAFSASPRLSPEEVDDPIAALNAAMDVDAQLKAHRRAAETAVSRIREARRSGASLYLTDMKAEDFEPVLRHAPDIVDLWLEGFSEVTVDFRRRVRLAEAAFLALCEALLAYDPIRGAQLWRALRATVTTRYIGAAGVEDLLHMVFRVPDSPAATGLREDLVGLEHCHTDQDLFDLAIATSYNSKADWLAAVIESDRASPLVWRRKRGTVLSGFTVNNRLPIVGAWPDGEIRTGHAELDRKSARFRWTDACARHWWGVYLAANEPSEAYAAWVLFLHSADRRAWIWMRKDVQAAMDTSAFFNLKLSHVELNRSKLKWAMEKRTDKIDQNFLDRKIAEGVGPWGKKARLT